ncbi:LPP20 family lipoprotein [Catenovulum maritimum]|uniref:LPP20 family lipoprotein n=1 Tax=Catenovulum maritimum TaxID=1513271 RepID=UPI000660EF21|nr:LPP20 family lipoprotein [Catenovulum maritimum]
MKTIYQTILVALLSITFSANADNQAFQTGIMQATGFGTVDMSRVANKVQARFMAKRAAQVDAQRNLAEKIRGIRLTAGTTVEDYEVTSDIIATRVKGTLEGTFIIDSQLTQEDGTYVATVVVGLCVNARADQCKGKQNLQQTLLEVLPEPKEKIEQKEVYKAQTSLEVPATAFVLDARNQAYNASLVTQVYTNTGKLVFSSEQFEQHPSKSLIWSKDPNEFNDFSPRRIAVSKIADQSNLIISEQDADALLQNINNSSLDGILVVLSD